MIYLLAYAAGLLTLINPCVLPVLPIVLATALNASRWGPVALAAGMSVSFVVLGMLVATLGFSLGITEEVVAQAGAVLMIAFGTVLLVPQLAHRFELVTAGFSARADAGIGAVGGTGLRGQFLGGLLLGAVWSPCIGPTLGGAIALASQGESLGQATAIMTAFALGVSTLLLGFGYCTQGVLRRRRDWLRALAGRARAILGVTFVAVGVAILLKLHQMAEAWMLGVMPAWLVDLSVSI
ncbi:MAG: cytochrome C biogenesis protein CcdA [Alphaproteobacteria bacterium HGW-Alphaproteobacteria-2]|nr:MAG: cytochrome C biogenesis protein CcdA [Alphaproteobacteria bacterium HGW-Alphaproteobacteria-2]